MATAFRRRGERLVGGFDAEEVEVVLHVLRLTRDFVAPERPGSTDPFLDLIAGLGEDADPQEPSDPALARLRWFSHGFVSLASDGQRILATVRSYTDLEPALLGRVEELIDFVTAPGA